MTGFRTSSSGARPGGDLEEADRLGRNLGRRARAHPPRGLRGRPGRTPAIHQATRARRGRALGMDPDGARPVLALVSFSYVVGGFHGPGAEARPEARARPTRRAAGRPPAPDPVARRSRHRGHSPGHAAAAADLGPRTSSFNISSLSCGWIMVAMALMRDKRRIRYCMPPSAPGMRKQY